MDTPRSFLFVTWEGGGNVAPVLGVARRLAQRGHAVEVLAEPCLRPAAERAGLPFAPIPAYFTRTDRAADLLGDAGARTPLGALRRTFDHVVCGSAPAVADATRRAIAARRPDVVVADAMLPGALAAAEAAGVPRAVLFHLPEFLPGPGRPASGPGFLPRTGLVGRLRDRLGTRVFYRVVAPTLGPYNDARQALGLVPLTGPEDFVEEFHRADLRLIQTAEAFDFPMNPPPANVRYVGPVLDEPDWVTSRSPAGWVSPWDPDDARPLVVVGLSTTPQGQGAVLARIAQALGRLDVRGLLTLGPALAGAQLDLPPNVVAVPGAPHGAVFPHAAVVVTHAGHGTVMRALAHGLPLLCLPMGRDQNDNAARVVARGAGLRLRPAASPGRVARAVRALLDEPAYRVEAGRLGAAIVAASASDRAVAELEALAARGQDARVAPSLSPVPA